MTTPSSTSHPAAITEDDIVSYLLNTPDFFDRHATLLANVQLISPHGNRTVSLTERQIELLREKLRAMELKHANLLRIGKENVLLADKLHQWMRDLLQMVGSPDSIELQVCASLMRIFEVPAVQILRTPAALALALTLDAPRCGVVGDAFFTDSGVLAEIAGIDQVGSLALAPLTLQHPPALAFDAAPASTAGLLVLTSPDAQRFTAQMGTEFLTRLGELVSARFSG